MDSHRSVSDASPRTERYQSGDGRIVRRGSVDMDLHSFTAYNRGRPLTLTRLEFDILLYLVVRAHRVVAQDELLREVVQGAHTGQTSLIRVHICNLRRKLGVDACVVETVRGRGVRFREPSRST